MAKLFLDANLAIYLNTVTGEDRPIIDRFFKALLTERLFTNLLVLDETLYVSRRRYAVPRAMTMDFLRRAFTIRGDYTDSRRGPSSNEKVSDQI